MNKITTIAFLCWLCLSFGIQAQRQKMMLNEEWKFSLGFEVKKDEGTVVHLPHTWNDTDALGGNIDYYRGAANYEKTIHVNSSWLGKRLILRFLGVNLVSNVFVNGKHIGEHRGGYTAFAYDISDAVYYGQDNHVMVKVSNAAFLDVMPLVGDFNFYGGIYRDVELYVMEHDAISLLDYGSHGVYLFPKDITEKEAEIEAVVKLLGEGANELSVQVLDAKEQLVVSQTQVLTVDQLVAGESRFSIHIPNPHLWNGLTDPYMYEVHIRLIRDQQVVDEVKQPLGIRYFHVDPDRGVFLNGKQLQLRGVCRHQDRPELGNALSSAHHREDTKLMREMGANALRMSHYPQAPYMYELMDQEGMVVWSEIPFVGPGGYRDKGYVDIASFKANGKLQLIEMIRQNMNHPSILFWGLFNELNEKGDHPLAYLEELEALAKREDPYRLTCAASNLDKAQINKVTDIIAWNKYYGWYSGSPRDIGAWADQMHTAMPNTPIGISEYGAGASLYHQQQQIEKTVPNSYWHPENWQTHFHENYWEQIDQRPYLWGSFVWNMFDFGAAHRTEGEKPGKNDKGIVSFDRKDKKDAFYFYKANWNLNDPMIYITERRLEQRINSKQTIKVYSNLRKVTLKVNGKNYSLSRKGAYGQFYFDIELNPGKNIIIAQGSQIKDEITLTLKKE